MAKMKFFTQAWFSGEMPDEQAAKAEEAYWRYIATLDLPPTSAALAQINPHDAFVLGAVHQPELSRLTLRLRCGDLQRGYSDVTLTFSRVCIDPAAIQTLQCAVRPAAVEVLWGEVGRSGECFEYRLLLYPKGEVGIQFQEVEVTERAAADRYAG